MTKPRRDPLVQAIADHVDASGLTHAALAYRLGMSRQAFTDRITGRTRWSAFELPPLCQALGISVTDLYTEAMQ